MASPGATVKSAELETLIRDWQKQADTAERLQADRGMDASMKRNLQMQVRVLDTCILDVRDLIAGLENPAHRRGTRLPEKEPSNA